MKWYLMTTIELLLNDSIFLINELSSNKNKNQPEKNDKLQKSHKLYKSYRNL